MEMAYVPSVCANSSTTANPSSIFIARPHSFAKASNTRSHSAGGGLSFRGTACVPRFVNVARIPAAAFFLSSFPARDQEHHVDEVFGPRIRPLDGRQRIRVEFFRKLLLRRDHGNRRRCDATKAEPIPAGHDLQRLEPLLD
jgi:hypothetical protein